MKLSERFRIQLLQKSWKCGIGSFLQTGLSMLISTHPSPIVSVLGYCRDCRDGVRFVGYKGEKILFQSFTTWEEIPNDIKKSLLTADDRQKDGFEDVIKRGWRLWIGTIGNKLAIFIWTRDSTHSTDFFFPIGGKGVLMWQAETSPAYRGMNLLPLLFDRIAQTLDAEGIHTMYATCAAYNLASKRVFEKANFHMIGRGIIRAGSGRGLVWIPSKKVQESKMSV